MEIRAVADQSSAMAGAEIDEAVGTSTLPAR
jgi:hypothetical protein